MKKLFKKNQIIITALALMIAAAGYLSYTHSSIGDEGLKQTSAELTEEDYDIVYDETLVDADIFTETEVDTKIDEEAAADTKTDDAAADGKKTKQEQQKTSYGQPQGNQPVRGDSFLLHEILAAGSGKSPQAPSC